MSRVRAWLRGLGAAGVLGLGLLFACVSFYFSTLLPAERELSAQRDAAERLRTRGPFPPVAADARAGDLQRFYVLFPALQQLTDELEGIHALARDARLELLQGEARLDRPGSGLVAYRITLPLRGTYAQVRSFVGGVLRDKPTVSVDALRFERRKIAETQIEAHVRLTLYFQPLDESETR